MELAKSDTVRDVIKAKSLRRTQALLSLQLGTLIGNLTCLLLRTHHMERVTSSRRSVESEDYCWFCRTRALNALVTLVEHSLDASIRRSSKYNVANL